MRFRSRKKCRKTGCNMHHDTPNFIESSGKMSMNAGKQHVLSNDYRTLAWKRPLCGMEIRRKRLMGVSKAIEKNGSENPNRSFLKMNGEATNAFSSAEGESVRVLHSQWR